MVAGLAAGRPPSRAGLLFWSLLVVAVLGRAVYVVLPVNSDTAMFVYAGKLAAEGGRPGVDLLDNKLPSVGLLMSAPWRLFGAHWRAYGLTGLGLSVGATFVLARAAGRCWGETAGRSVALASAVWLNLPPVVYGQLQLETIQVFLTATAGGCVLAWLRGRDWRDAYAAGLCTGLAMWAKPTAGAVLLAAAVVMATRRRGRTGVLWLLAGVAGPVLLCLWLLILTGAAGALPATLRQVHDYAAGSTFDAMDAAKPLLVLLAAGFPCLVIGRVFRHDRTRSRVRGPETLFVLLWLAAETAAVVSQRRMYAYHFLVLAPPAALATGLFARRYRPAMLAGAFGPAVAVTALWLATTLPAVTYDTRDARVIAYLNARTNAGDAVWMDDYPRALVETGRRPGSAVPLIFLFANSDAAPAQFSSRLLADLAQTRPTVVVLARDPARLADLYRHHMAEAAGSPRRADAIAAALQRVQRYVEQRYRPEADLGGVRVWRRNDDALAWASAAD